MGGDERSRDVESQSAAMPDYPGDIKEGAMPSVSVFVLAVALYLPVGPSQSQSAQPANPPQSNPSAGTQSSAQSSSNDQSKADANQNIQSSLGDLLSNDEILDGTDVQVAVNDQTITLSGTVQSFAQHQRVLQLAAQYGRWRQIVDKIQLK